MAESELSTVASLAPPWGGWWLHRGTCWDPGSASGRWEELSPDTGDPSWVSPPSDLISMWGGPLSSDCQDVALRPSPGLGGQRHPP